MILLQFQVHADFAWIGGVYALSCACIYGGSAYGPQEGLLRRGTDIVVGTPGRVKDMLEKGVLKLNKLRWGGCWCNALHAS